MGIEPLAIVALMLGTENVPAEIAERPPAVVTTVFGALRLELIVVFVSP
jgi:hypothetical protein